MIIVRIRSGDTAFILLLISVLLDHFLSGKVSARVRGSEEVGAEQELEGQGQVQV